MYYVTCINDTRVAYLAGPFAEHAAAIGAVESVRRIAEQIDPFAAFYAFGTARRESGNKIGILNGKLDKEIQSAILPA